MFIRIRGRVRVRGGVGFRVRVRGRASVGLGSAYHSPNLLDSKLRSGGEQKKK